MPPRMHTHLFSQGRTSGIVSQGKSVAITDLPAPYLIDQTHTENTSMSAHTHFRHPSSSAVLPNADHTQTKKFVLWSKNVPSCLPTHTHTHFYSLAHIITSNPPSTLWLAEISWGIFRCVTCSKILSHHFTVYLTVYMCNIAAIPSFDSLEGTKLPHLEEKVLNAKLNKHQQSWTHRIMSAALGSKTPLINACHFFQAQQVVMPLKKAKRGRRHRGCSGKKTVKYTG